MFESKKDMVREFLNIIGARRKYENSASILAKQYSVYGLGDIIQEAATNLLDELFENTVEIYNNRLDKSTLRNILKFYKSNAGKELVKSSIDIEKDMAVMSSQWQSKMLEAAAVLVLKRQAEKGINASDYIPPIEEPKQWYQ